MARRKNPRQNWFSYSLNFLWQTLSDVETLKALTLWAIIISFGIWVYWNGGIPECYMCGDVQICTAQTPFDCEDAQWDEKLGRSTFNRAGIIAKRILRAVYLWPPKDEPIRSSSGSSAYVHTSHGYSSSGYQPSYSAPRSTSSHSSSRSSSSSSSSRSSSSSCRK